MDNKNTFEKDTQNLVIENRNKMSVSGVEEVDSFDETYVSLYTIMGSLTVEGNNLHINQLNVQTGDVTIEGDIDAVKYSDNNTRQQGNIISRLFK